MKTRHSIFFMTLFIFLLTCPALGEVGKVSGLAGKATRAVKDGTPVPLEEGTAIELGDTVEVTAGELKLTLTDQSVLMLAEGSRLVVDEASFEELDRRRFSARLLVGTLWAEVTKALSGDARFEVATERAVAGVRGTLFQVEVQPGEGGETSVGVMEGEVAVEERSPQPALAQARGRLELLAAGEQLVVKRGGLFRGKLYLRPGRFRRFLKSHRLERRLERMIQRRLDLKERRRLR